MATSLVSFFNVSPELRVAWKLQGGRLSQENCAAMLLIRASLRKATQNLLPGRSLAEEAAWLGMEVD